MIHNIKYTASQVSCILQAYRTLFPRVEEELATYWDYERRRQWSCLTTNFHQASADSIQSFDKDVIALQEKIGDSLNDLSHDAIGKLFREISLRHNIGYSIGISPWTDDLLLRTFRDETRRVIIILGHDWYPIVADTKEGLYVPRSPLQRDSILDAPKYKDAIPDKLCQINDCAILFLNLYPDFRPPDAASTGSLGDYTQWIRGVGTICRLLAEQWYLQGLISWGRYVWKAMRPHVEDKDNWKRTEILDAVRCQYENGWPLRLKLNGVAIPYYAFAHPSSPNFKNKLHWAAYQAACSTLVNS